MGFILGENTTLGPKYDFFYALKQLEFFERDFKFTFFNYDKIDSPTRISPVFILIIFFLKKIFINLDLVRFILLNIILLNQILFYQSLKLIFYKKIGIDKKLLFLLSCVIFLSPSFRANAIWPESAMLGLLFFNISIYFFLRFIENREGFISRSQHFLFSRSILYKTEFCCFFYIFSILYNFFIKNFKM